MPSLPRTEDIFTGCTDLPRFGSVCGFTRECPHDDAAQASVGHEPAYAAAPPAGRVGNLGQGRLVAGNQRKDLSRPRAHRRPGSRALASAFARFVRPCAATLPDHFVFHQTMPYRVLVSTIAGAAEQDTIGADTDPNGGPSFHRRRTKIYALPGNPCSVYRMLRP